MTICKQPIANMLCEVLSMTQLYVLSQDGTSAINLSQFEYVYIGEDNRIKAVNGQPCWRKSCSWLDAVLRQQKSGGWLVSDDA